MVMQVQRVRRSDRSVAGVVPERNAQPDAVAGHRAVLDRHVLSENLCDPQRPVTIPAKKGIEPS